MKIFRILGKSIREAFKSIFRNPICYRIKDTLLALRNEDACNIEVSYE